MKSSAFILDFNLLKEQNISVEEFLTLLTIDNYELLYICDYKYCDTLEEKGFIKRDPSLNENSITIRAKGILLLELVTIDNITSNTNKAHIKKSSRAINSELTDEFISTYRQLWKGLKLGSMGSESACKAKLTRWMYENPSFTANDILKAAKLYIDSLVDYRFLQTADYFIFKKDGKEESSRLSAFIDEIDNEEVKDWTTNLN
jgi:hypothetical protein